MVRNFIVILVLHTDIAIDLSSLPFGALRKAQHALAQAKVVSESDDESEDESGPEEQVTQLSAMGKEKEKEKEKEREKREVAKRKHKHACVLGLNVFPSDL